MPRPRYLLVSLTLIAVMASPLHAVAQTPSDIHIEVFVKPPRAHSSVEHPAPRLTPRNFQLRQQGQSIPFHLAQPSKNAPSHLLVVLPKSLSSCEVMALPASLHDLLSQRWALGIAGNGGAATTYFSGQNAWQAACHSAPAAGHPIAALEKLPGRRVLVFIGSPSPALMAAASRALPEVYAVDGGIKFTNYTAPMVIPKDGGGLFVEGPYTVRVDSIDGRVRPGSRYTEGTSFSYKADAFRHDVMHEKTFNSAVKDILNASGRYYDLAFQLPTATATAPLDLGFRHMDNLSFRVAMYSQSDKGDQTLAQRTPAAAHLVLSQH